MGGRIAVVLLAGMLFVLNGCNRNVNDEIGMQMEVQSQRDALGLNQENAVNAVEGSLQTKQNGRNMDIFSITNGTKEYQGFVLDNILHSKNEGDIHFNLYLPDTYDGSKAYALFLTLPGYEGLYFQGVGANLIHENFGFTAREYNPEMIIVAPQLEDWGESSADQTIELMEYILGNYNIDPEKVYAEGYSAGGVTMSQVIGKRPELFTAYLQCSSRWAGNYEQVINNRVPIYFAIGQDDEYYGSEPSREAYEILLGMYRQEGLSESEIDEILVLDIKDESYFESQGISNQHGGGLLFAEDQEVMNWLFGK